MSHRNQQFGYSFVSLVVTTLFAATVTWAASPYAWVEGEFPTQANAKGNVESTEHPTWLSGEKWLRFVIEPHDLDKVLPADGLELKYEFKAPATGENQFWARLGFDSARSPFQWRVDGDEWHDAPANTATTDLTELSFFTEISWQHLGDADLTEGKHTLELRVPKAKDARGAEQRLVFAIDAACVMPGPFTPYGRFKPDEDHRSDADKAAATHVFELPPEPPTNGGRSTVSLKGDWDICRADEIAPGEVTQPMTDLPAADVRWSSIAVPGDKGVLRPDLLFAHRVWYRTRVNVPASYARRSFVVEFPQNNLNTTVVVNGRLCGFEKNPFVRFSIDITPGIKPGQVNEILVGIRDAWYGYQRDPQKPEAMRKLFWMPRDFFSKGFQHFVYPEWNHPQSGILETPTLTSTGPTYASDVFVKPNVAEKKLEVEITINTAAERAQGEVMCQVVDPKSRQVVKTLDAVPFDAASNAAKIVKVSGAWADARLWWPEPDAQLYTLRTTVRLKNVPADVQDTTFGFRQWQWEGHDFKLNGQVWHGWAEPFIAHSADEWLAYYRKNNERFTRFWAPQPFFGMEDHAALDWFDRNGVVVRRTGVLDGESMGYDSSVVDELSHNWIDQECAMVRGERNHPSIMIWSLENEISYINAMNGNWIDRWEKVTAAIWEKIHADIDPTRPAMVDGGGAGKANLLPVHGDHYVATDPSRYPNAAYQANPTGGSRNVDKGYWTWDQKRPRFIGEDFFYNGNHPELAGIGGEAAFGGKQSTHPACSLMWSALQQGYRWANYGAWNLWLGQDNGDNSQYLYYAPRAALVKQWDWTFRAASTVHRTVGVFNDSFSADPIEFKWDFALAGRHIDGKTQRCNVAPGERLEIDLPLTMPAVTGRQEGELVLSLSVGGTEVFRDTKAVSVVQPVSAAPDSVHNVFVIDPEGHIGPFLKSKGLAITSIEKLTDVTDAAKVLVLGRNSIRAAESTSTALAALASTGRAIIVLEQTHPLKYQALPAEFASPTAGGPRVSWLDPAATNVPAGDVFNAGELAFPANPNHPSMANLQGKDFFAWPGQDTGLFFNAYGSPERGATSLLQCGPSLRDSALVEVPVGKGLLLLCQARVEEKLTDSAASQQLLLNLIDYAGVYKQTVRDVTATIAGAPPLSKAIDAIGLRYTPTADPIESIARPGGVAVVSASPANLAKLVDNLPKLEAFTHGGGWLILNGLTPDGLASYNKLVGVRHLLRPFKRERVQFTPVHDPLLAGVTTGDVSMHSSKNIFPYQEGKYVVNDEFSYVVDYDDVAPFAKSSFGSYDNIVNGFVNADGWPLIANFPVPADESPFDVPMELPRAESLSEITWIGNTNYWLTTKIRLKFADGTSNPVVVQEFSVEPTSEPQVLKIDPVRNASKVVLQLVGWEKRPGVRPLIGIDNISLRAQRSPEFHEKVQPMLNVGGLVRYPQGSGGVVLCNLQFKDAEEVPANAVKKQKILAAILRNLHAPFAGAKTVIAGAHLTYSPVDISHHANAFRNEKSWFDKKFTFADLPTGDQRFAGVNYNVYELSTSPVPTVIMLGGPANLPADVKGIPVNRKADALFFLQAAKINQRLTPDQVKKNVRVELFHYVVHYADGKSEAVPVYSEFNIDNAKQDGLPRVLPGAQVAWSASYAGTSSSAVAYSQQWNNPFPDVTITSIDMTQADFKRGVSVLVAITAAQAENSARRP